MTANSLVQDNFQTFLLEVYSLQTGPQGQNTSRCGGTVYALVSKTSPARVEGSNLSTGIARLPMSTAVFHALYRPIESLPGSTEIYGCLPCLLSVLLSA